MKMDFIDKPAPLWLSITLSVVFPPLGLWMLYINLTQDKLDWRRNSKITRAYSWLVLAVGAVALCMVPFVAPRISDVENVVVHSLLMVLIFFGVGSRMLASQAKQIAENGARYDEVVAAVQAGERSIDSIAKGRGLTYKEMVLELRRMMELGYLGGARIDENLRLIRIGDEGGKKR